MVVYFCSTVDSAVILFPRHDERPNVSASGKGPLNIINYLIILSACRWPIFEGFLLHRLLVERYSNVCTENLFTDNSLGVEIVRTTQHEHENILHR